jgi:hypothetical protein
MKRRRTLWMTVMLLFLTGYSGIAAGQTLYEESFDDVSLWSGGSAGSYTYKSFIQPGAPDEDLFEADVAIRESTNAISGYAWRLKNSDNPTWTYRCWETVVEFSVHLATWNVSTPMSVTVSYSLDGGSSYTLLDSFDETWWSGQGYGDKDYREFSSGTLNVTPVIGSQLLIRIGTDGNERLLIDDFQLFYGTGNPAVEDPLSFTATASNAYQIELTFAPNDANDDVVIAFNENGTFESPAGIPPSPGALFAGGTLLYQGTASPQDHSGLSPGQTVHYKAWSYNGTEYSQGLTNQATTPMPSITPNAWINEIHYDNEGGDVNEFVEILVEDATVMTLEALSVFLYNGSAGTVYAQISAEQLEQGISLNGFTIYTWTYSGIQNGAPEGMALAYNGNLIDGQFLSYEGTFTASEGPASGLVSVDIGVEEPASTPVGYSLQLSGSGVLYSQFMWQPPAGETPGELNLNQELGMVTQWTGVVNSDWHQADNWTNEVPSDETEAWIPGPDQTGVYPSISSYAEAAKLWISSGAELEIAPTGALTVSGMLTNNGSLVIRSDESGSGSLIAAGDPTATIEQYIGPDSWHYISSPVHPVFSDVFEGLYLMEWSEPDESWIFIEELGVPLNTGLAGYGVWAEDATLVSFTGDINNGPYTIPVYNTEGTSTPENDPSGYNLVGNPYASALDWDVEDGSGWTRTSTQVANAVYYWNGINYASYVKDGPNPGPNGGTNVIPPHQGFFIKCLSTEGGSLAVDNGAQIHGNQNFYKSSKNNNSFLRIRIATDTLSDEVIVHLHENATFQYDGAYDAGHLSGCDIAPQIYARTPQGLKLAIHSIPPVESSVVIPLGFAGGSASDIHEISLEEMNGFEEIPIYLEDLNTNTIIEFQEGVTYKFFASPGVYDNRIKLHFYSDDITEQQNLQKINSLRAFSKGSSIVLHSDEPVEGRLQLFDTSGKRILSERFTETRERIFTTEGLYGIYFARIVTRSGVWTGKFFLTGGVDSSW